jgi:HK97 family phage major capsid protein
MPETVENTVDVAAIAKAAAEQAVKAYQEKLEAERPTNAGLQVVADEADRLLEAKPFKNLGEFLMAIVHGGDKRLGPTQSTDPLDEQGYNVGKAIGFQEIGSLYDARQKLAQGKAISGMSELVPADGGLLVQTDTRLNIMSRVYQVGQLLQRVAMIGISANSNGLTLYADAENTRVTGGRRGGVQSFWAAEGDQKTGSHPTFREINFKLSKLVGLVYATDELLADANALEGYVMQVLPEELRFRAEDAIINGTGAGMPLGVLGAPCLVTQAAEAGQAIDTVISENILNMYSRRWAGVNDYVWLINQQVTPQLWQMNLGAGAAGVLTYMPAGGLSAAPYATLMGRPVLELEYCSLLGNVGDIILFSPSQYQMIDKGGVQSAMSIHVRFIFDEQTFRFVYRIDGRPLWQLPLTPFTGAAQSPFVTLAAR